MRVLLLFVLCAIQLTANSFDMFDDDTPKSFDSTLSPHYQMKVGFNYESTNNSMTDQKQMIFYQTMDYKNYFIDYDITTNFDDLRINIKELYYKHKLSARSFIDIGRINIKEGIARSYNPTDYFKGSGLLFNSLITRDRRENRLGSLMIAHTLFFHFGSVKCIVSPQISAPKDSLWSDKQHIGLHLDATNYTNRASFYTSINLDKDLFTSAMIHKNEDGLHFGTNISYVYHNWLFYNESTIKRSKDNLAKSIEYYHYDLLKKHFDTNTKTIYQGVFGLSYTSENNIETIVEYIFNGAGMRKSEWKKYFLLRQNTKHEQQLMSIRKYHHQKEAFFNKETLFAQVRFNEVKPNFDIAVLSFVNLYDHSSLNQLTLRYSKHDFQLKLSARKRFGAAQSEYGSLDKKATYIAECKYYF